LIFFEQTLIEKFSADFDFLFSIAITIAIENPIRINRVPVFHCKTDRVFFYSIRIRLNVIMQTPVTIIRINWIFWR